MRMGTGSHWLISEIQERIPQIERSAKSAVSSAKSRTLTHYLRMMERAEQAKTR